jgi:two-component system, NtrC family, C4-dicarboxylate transport sensor histidine kinase DctB
VNAVELSSLDDRTRIQTTAGVRRFTDWLATLDPDGRKAVVDPKSWLGVTAIALMVIFVTGVIPATHEVFRLRATPALLAYLPTLALGLTIGTLEKRGQLTLASYGIWCLFGSLLFQSFMWSLVALSELPGSALLASFPVLLAAYHGHVFRSAPQSPYVAVATLLAIGVAMLIAHDRAHLAVYAAAGPVALGSAVVLGQNAIASHQARLRSTALREAIDAQILSERARQVSVVTQALDRLHGTSHDAGNALSGALFNLEQLAVEVRRRPLTEERCERIAAICGDLMSSAGRLRRLLEDARDTAHDGRPALERVCVHACAQTVLREVEVRFPHVQLDLRLQDPALEQASVAVCGGELSMHRVLTNLVTNACQGDGASRPSKVMLTLAADRRGDWLLATISDDGPGFPVSMIESPFRGFYTTKEGGTGLGLYTAERLVRASEGELTIANASAPDRGARVNLSLRR